VLRAAGETETTQGNIQDWLQFDGDPGFQLLTEEEIATVIYLFIYFHRLLLKVSIYLFSELILSFRAIFLH
jgi:uncharacterized protein YehS (DUF1456 family)